MTELFEAIAAADPERARELARTTPELREQRDAQGLLPAMRALYGGDRELAESLLPPGTELNAFEAAAFGRLERLIELLGDRGAANGFSPDGFTPLHLACFSGGPEAARLLVEHGAELEALARSDFARVRPLGTAAFRGDAESGRVLLEAGADPNGRGEGGFTPLHSASQNGDAELVDLLLEHGANPGEALPDGRTPADVAREHGHSELADRLSTRTA